MEITIKQQRGVVILENLVAILIFSLGILGIVGMLGTSMKNSASAKYRSDASMLANQVIGQMWTNDKTNASLKADFESPGGAKYADWQSSVAAVLPGVDAKPPTITIDADNMATITVWWQSPGEAQPHNYVVVAKIND